MSDTSELLTTFMAAGAVGEVQRHLEIVPPLEEARNTVENYAIPAPSIGATALSDFAEEPDPAQPKGIRRTPLRSAPEDEFGQRIYAISDGDPDIVGKLLVKDRIETATRRHAANNDRFVAATLMIGKLPLIDAEIADHHEKRMNRSVDILPNPTIPPLFEKQVAKATAKRSAGQVKDTASAAIRRYRDKPLIKDQIK